LLVAQRLSYLTLDVDELGAVVELVDGMGWEAEGGGLGEAGMGQFEGSKLRGATP